MKRRILLSILAFFVLLVIIALINIFYLHNTKFFEFNIVNFLTLLVAAFFAFYLSSRMADEKRYNEKLDSIISKIQDIVNSDQLYKVTKSDDIRYITMRIRAVNNKLDILAKQKHTNLNAEIEYIKKQFKEYKDNFSNHIDDLTFLQQSEYTLQRNLLLIDDKCDEMHLKL